MVAMDCRFSEVGPRLGFAIRDEEGAKEITRKKRKKCKLKKADNKMGMEGATDEQSRWREGRRFMQNQGEELPMSILKLELRN